MILNSQREIAATNRARCDLYEINAPAAKKPSAKKFFWQIIGVLVGCGNAFKKIATEPMARFEHLVRLVKPKLLTTSWCDHGIGFVRNLSQHTYTNYSY